jgi:transposase
MSDKKHIKRRINVSPEQKLEYAKLMVEDGYSNQQVVEISGSCSSAVTRWKRQYLKELNGDTPQGKKALTPEQQRIQELEKQLWRAKRDNEILKKATGDSTDHCNTTEIFCDGDKNFNVFLGRSFNSSAIISSCSCE